MITIETKGKPTKEFFDEYQSLRLKYKRLIKNPKKKLKSAVNTTITYTAILTILSIFYIVFSYYTNDRFLMFWSVLLVVFTCFYIIFTALLLKTRKKFLSDYTKRIITIDENGISLNSDKQNVLIKWESIKYIVINKYTVGVLPDNVGNLMLALSTDYKEDILKGVAEYSHSDLIIDNSDLYK